MADYHPQVPAGDRQVPLWTYADAVDHLLDRHDLDRTDGRNLRLMRRAVETAYREFTQAHTWKYYDRYTTVRTLPEQTTGTVEYTHDGRELDLSGATWPEDARFCRVIIDSSHYDVESRESDTKLILSRSNNPGEDLDAGTTYNLYRRAYPLPPQFRTLQNVHDVESRMALSVIDSDSQQWRAIGLPEPGLPIAATVRNEGEFFGGMSLVFDPPPNEDRLYEVFYRAAPRPLTTESESTGTVETDGTETTVTGTTTVFAAKHVGDVIRLSTSTTTVPTGFAGSPPTDDLGGDGTYSPFEEQRIIQTVASATELEVDVPFSEYEDVKLIISSPLDIRGDSMLSAFLRACEAEYAEIKGLDDAEKQRARADRALALAMENDAILQQAATCVPFDRFSHTTFETVEGV